MTEISNRTIRYAYYLLFFLTPLLLTPLNYELFEFNKMLFVYGISIIVGSAWMIRMTIEKRIIFRQTPLDIPIALFLIAHLISTINSIDPHISVWGYYGRYNGGLVSLISYLVLYYGLVSNLNDGKNNKPILNMLFLSLASGFLVSLYGIAQHFGIDAHIWVQDVQNRVFSTLGQPNWLAAYLTVLLPISFSMLLNYQVSNFNDQTNLKPKQERFENWKIGNWKLFDNWSLVMGVLSIIFYITLLFTKSRSGFFAFWISNTLFWIGVFLINKVHQGRTTTKPFQLAFGINLALIFVTTIIGSPFSQINNLFSFQKENVDYNQEALPDNTTDGSLNTGYTVQNTNVTDSGDIRKLVWQGAIDAARARPYFGWGVETFAWVFYRFKPIEHNLTSEWDFLYNKAHNEYLNYAATTGLVGLGSYLLFIGTSIGWFLTIFKSQFSSFKHNNEKLKIQNWKLFDNWNLKRGILSLGLFSGWLSLLITNFFGFSVVVTSLYFWLIPAVIVVLFQKNESIGQPAPLSLALRAGLSQWIPVGAILGTALYLLWSLVLYWRADYFYADARSAYGKGNYASSYRLIIKSITARPYEPVYHDQLASTLAHLATPSSELIEQAIAASNIALQLSPGNVSFWKSRTRMFYNLSQIDEKYSLDALNAVLEAQSRAPTDPLIAYNVGIVYELNNNRDKALESFKKALELKKDYKDAAWALAIFYADENPEESEKWLKYILEQIDPNDQEVKKKLESDTN